MWAWEGAVSVWKKRDEVGMTHSDFREESESLEAMGGGIDVSNI